jgi:hypothetical protein
VRLKKFIPRQTSAWEKALRSYAAIEAGWIEDETSILVHQVLH